MWEVYKNKPGELAKKLKFENAWKMESLLDFLNKISTQ